MTNEDLHAPPGAPQRAPQDANSSIPSESLAATLLAIGKANQNVPDLAQVSSSGASASTDSG
jgi:hypothetical protein